MLIKKIAVWTGTAVLFSTGGSERPGEERSRRMKHIYSEMPESLKGTYADYSSDGAVAAVSGNHL